MVPMIQVNMMVYSFILYVNRVYTMQLYPENPLNMFTLRLSIVVVYLVKISCILAIWFKFINTMSTKYERYKIIGSMKV